MTDILGEEEMHILQHALGLSQTGGTYRNHYCTSPISRNGKSCESLVEHGFMASRGPISDPGGMHVYQVTHKGRELAEEAYNAS